MRSIARRDVVKDNNVYILQYSELDSGFKSEQTSFPFSSCIRMWRLGESWLEQVSHGLNIRNNFEQNLRFNFAYAGVGRINAITTAVRA